MGSPWTCLILIFMLCQAPLAQTCILEDGLPGPNDIPPYETAEQVDMENRNPPIRCSISGFFTENLGQKGEGAGHLYCQAEPLSVSFGTTWVAYDYRPPEGKVASCFRVSFE